VDVTRALAVVAAITVMIAGVVAFFTWAGRVAARRHARFTHLDVLTALENAIDPDTYYDEWEMFLAWPIDDPYLESIRQRCLPMEEWDPGDKLTARLKPILEEVKAGMNGQSAL